MDWRLSLKLAVRELETAWLHADFASQTGPLRLRKKIAYIAGVLRLAMDDFRKLSEEEAENDA